MIDWVEIGFLEVSADKKDGRWFYDDSEFGTEQLIERSEALAKVEL